MNNQVQYFDAGTNIKIAYKLSLPSSTNRKLIAISHPLSRLGGSSNDRVVTVMAEYFFHTLGFGVLTYDSRGAGDSTGSSSYSSIPEAEDYAALVESILLPLFPSPSSSVNILVCAGYSAGSLSASYYLPPSHLIAKHHLQTSYLLISYPHSVMFLLTLFRSGPFQANLNQNRKERKVLAIWGDGDQFSSAIKLRKWSREMEEGKGVEKGWKGVEIEGADHFWTNLEKRQELLNAVGTWVEEEVNVEE